MEKKKQKMHKMIWNKTHEDNFVKKMVMKVGTKITRPEGGARSKPKKDLNYCGIVNLRRCFSRIK